MNGTETPRVYVACLASYNAGILHGAWVDATDEDEVQECIEQVLKTSSVPNAEEHAFHDYENFGMNMHEYDSIERVTTLGALIEEHGQELVSGLIGHGFCTVDTIEEALQDRRLGVHGSLGEYMEEMYEGLEIPEPVRIYIDWEAKGRDEEINGSFFTIEVGDDLHFFSN